MKTRFLIEIEPETGNFRHDFCWAISQSVAYHDWYYKDNSNFCATKVHTRDEEKIFDMNKGMDASIPIGSVEYIHRYLKTKGLQPPGPLNIPLALRDPKFLQRQVEEKNLTDIEWTQPWFIKPATEVKKFTGFVTDTLANAQLFEPQLKDDQLLFVSEPIDVVSEYRCLVQDGKLLAIRHYSGDFTIFPNVKLIKDMIKTYTECPPVYTLDVGVTKKKVTVIIELHHFYAVGLYGYHDTHHLPYLFQAWWQWFLDQNKA
jgi:hypothetical protein